MKLGTIILLLLGLITQGFSQVKHEKELKADLEEVPSNATRFVESMNFPSTIKWIKEIGNNSISFEAKTKYLGKRYSIEFSENGIFEDIEVEVNPGEIPEEVLETIINHFDTEHEKYAIEKIQVQYSGDPSLVLDYLQERVSNKCINLNYEIVISTKLQGTYVMLEYLFSDAGEFKNKSKIQIQRTDNIIY